MIIKQSKNSWSWLWLSALIVFLDQTSKYFVLRYLNYAQPYEVFSFLDLYLRYNAGAAFGFLDKAAGWQVFLLSGFSILVVIAVALWLGRISSRHWALGFALSLILGGALGNLIDRLRFRHVIDFLDFHTQNWHFATFNIADTAITVGAFCLVIQLLFSKS